MVKFCQILSIFVVFSAFNDNLGYFLHLVAFRGFPVHRAATLYH